MRTRRSGADCESQCRTRSSGSSWSWGDGRRNLPTITIFGGSSSPWSVPAGRIKSDRRRYLRSKQSAHDDAGHARGRVRYDDQKRAYEPVCTRGRQGANQGSERFYEIDIKDPQGSDGWTITYGGLRPKPFDIEFYIWTQAQLDSSRWIIPAIQYSGAKGNVQALHIHPGPGANFLFPSFSLGIAGNGRRS